MFNEMLAMLDEKQAFIIKDENDGSVVSTILIDKGESLNKVYNELREARIKIGAGWDISDLLSGLSVDYTEIRFHEEEF